MCVCVCVALNASYSINCLITLGDAFDVATSLLAGGGWVGGWLNLTDDRNRKADSFPSRILLEALGPPLYPHLLDAILGI